MFDTFLLTINQWMNASFYLAIFGSFLWGVVSVLFSPCHLASIPLIMAYIAGQKGDISSKKASLYAGVFCLGIFTSITLLGIICTILGRMLGDIPPLWEIPVGLTFIYLGLHLLGISSCRLPSFANRTPKANGLYGAFVIGLTFGVLSGACTFGFIAPILVMVTIKGQSLQGLVLLFFFTLGHCLPIITAGSSATCAQKIIQHENLKVIAHKGRQIAGIIVFLVGVYIIINAISTAI